MSRALLAGGVAMAILVSAYGLVAVVGALAGGWSQATLGDQLLGLGIHAAVVFVRGLLPAVLATLLVLWAARRLGLGGANSARPAWRALVASSLLAAGLVVPLLLASPLGSWPRLRLDEPGSGLATVALLAAASSVSVWTAGWRMGRSGERPASRPQEADPGRGSAGSRAA